MKAEETNFAVLHKPTKLWVYFKQSKIEDRYIICLCLRNDATVSASKEQLINLINKGEFNSEPLYGQTNFLEFEIKKV